MSKKFIQFDNIVKCLNMVRKIFFFNFNEMVQVGIVSLERIHISDFIIGKRLSGIIISNRVHIP